MPCTSFRCPSAAALLALASVAGCRERAPARDPSLPQDLAMAQRPGPAPTVFNDAPIGGNAPAARAPAAPTPRPEPPRARTTSPRATAQRNAQQAPVARTPRPTPPQPTSVEERPAPTPTPAAAAGAIRSRAPVGM